MTTHTGRNAIMWSIVTVCAVCTDPQATRCQNLTVASEFELIDKSIAKISDGSQARRIVGAGSVASGNIFVASTDAGPRSPFGAESKFVIHTFRADQPTAITTVRAVDGVFAGFLSVPSSTIGAKSKALVARCVGSSTKRPEFLIEEVDSGLLVARIAERTGHLAGHLTFCPRRQLFSFVERAFNTREAQDGYAFVVFDAVNNADLLRIELKNEIPTGISISTSGEEVAFVSNRISDVTRDLRGTIIENAKADMTKGLVESKDEIGILRLCKLKQGANASEVALQGMRLDCVLFSEDNLDIFVGSTESGKPELRDLYGLGVSVPVWTPKLTLLVLESTDGSLRQKIDLPLPTLREVRVDGVPRVKDMDLSRDGSRLAVGFGSDNRGGKWGRVSLIATRTLLLSTPKDMPEGEAASFVTMSDSDFCVAGGPFGQLFVWKVGRPR